MTVTYDSLEAQVIGAIITMLAGSASFRTLTGAADAAAAKAFIVEIDGGDEIEATGGAGYMVSCTNAVINRGTALGWAHVCDRPVDNTGETHALLTWSRTAEIPVRIWWKRIAADTPPERRRRALNILGNIRADMEAQFSATNCLPGGRIDVRLDAGPDDAGWARTFDVGTLTINWRSLP